MSNKRNDGGPAFPLSSPAAAWEPLKDDVPAHWRPADGIGGMTLRDYFAAKAMQMKFGASGEFTTMEQMADWCYQMADSMLKAREA